VKAGPFCVPTIEKIRGVGVEAGTRVLRSEPHSKSGMYPWTEVRYHEAFPAIVSEYFPIPLARD
jgi:hypothetical protein